jgi:ATP-dependent DNA helicase RecG
LTPENFAPDPRNPIIANFFRVIGYADQLGSGVRNLYKYAKAYGGADPQLMDGDVFRIEVSLKSLKFAQIDAEVAPIDAEVAPIDAEVAPISAEVAPKLRAVRRKLEGRGRADAIENAIAVFKVIMENGGLSIPDMESRVHLSNGSVKNAIRLLRLNEIIRRNGSNRNGKWVALV